MARSDIQSFSRDELKRRRDAGQTDTQPEPPAYAVPDDFWAGAKIRIPVTPGKTHISMRIDTDVLDWYRQQGVGYLTRMNAVLRSFMEQMGDRQRARSATEEGRTKARKADLAKSGVPKAQKPGSGPAQPEAGSPVSARRRKTS